MWALRKEMHSEHRNSLKKCSQAHPGVKWMSLEVPGFLRNSDDCVDGRQCVFQKATEKDCSLAICSEGNRKTDLASLHSLKCK